MSYTLTIDGAPRSVNRTNQHWTARKRETDTWHTIVAVACIGRKIPRPAFPQGAIVEIELRSPRKRDPDNVAKVLLDALVKCGVLEDDSFPSLHETRLRARRSPTTHLEITIREAEC